MQPIWPPVPWHNRLARCASCLPEDFAPERLAPYGTSSPKIYVRALGADAGKSGLSTAMVILGVILFAGLALAVSGPKKAKLDGARRARRR